MSRFKAAGIHLGISFVIFVFLAYLVLFEWYPGIFFNTDGGWRGMRIIVGVDLVLGPTLTLVAYKAGKPGLKFDLTAIALLQTVCLIAGTYVVWSEKPRTVVYVDGRIQVVTTDDYRDNGFDGVPDLSHIPGDSPKWVRVDVPEGLEAEADFRSDLLRKGTSIIAAVDHYEPFDPHHPGFTEDPRDLARIRKLPGAETALKKWTSEHGGTLEDYNFYLFTTRYVYRYAGFHRTSGDMLGFLDLKPR